MRMGWHQRHMYRMVEQALGERLVVAEEADSLAERTVQHLELLRQPYRVQAVQDTVVG